MCQVGLERGCVGRPVPDKPVHPQHLDEHRTAHPQPATLTVAAVKKGARCNAPKVEQALYLEGLQQQPARVGRCAGLQPVVADAAVTQPPNDLAERLGCLALIRAGEVRRECFGRNLANRELPVDPWLAPLVRTS